MTPVILAKSWICIQCAIVTASAFVSSSLKNYDGIRLFAKKQLVQSRHTHIFSTSSGSGHTDTFEELHTVLVTGGTGYIGSHTCLELLNTERYRVVVIDNLENSKEESLNRVQQLVNSNIDVDDRLHFRKCDIRDGLTLSNIFEEFPDISSCIHFAGLKAVGESVAKPLEYY